MITHAPSSSLTGCLGVSNDGGRGKGSERRARPIVSDHSRISDLTDTENHGGPPSPSTRFSSIQCRWQLPSRRRRLVRACGRAWPYYLGLLLCGHKLPRSRFIRYHTEETADKQQHSSTADNPLRTVRDASPNVDLYTVCGLSKQRTSCHNTHSDPSPTIPTTALHCGSQSIHTAGRLQASEL